jgi:hypothetical protein
MARGSLNIHVSSETIKSSKTLTILDIIHCSVFYEYLKHDISETGFCLRLQVEPSHS